MHPAKKISLSQPILILVGVAIAILWLINTLNTGNPFWFLPFQPTYTPSRIVIYHYGEKVTLRPGDEQFNEITTGLNTSLSSFRSNQFVSLGLSDDTQQRYYEEEYILEIFFPQNIEFNLPIRFDNINQLLVPIDARHSGNDYIFVGRNRAFQAGALQVEDLSPLETALELANFAVQP